jgi:tight adherence protein B
VNRHQAALAVLGVVIVAGVGQVSAGPVAGAGLAAYGLAAAWLLHRTRDARQFAHDRVGAVDVVSILAAELRAGSPVPVALAAAHTDLGQPIRPGAREVVSRLASAVDLAETSGAPLADVLDRLDHHLRAMDRARRSAQAHAAGARASALLLAGLPVAGVGLGYLLDVDPLHVLLHTQLGAGCFFGSIVLQLAGLAWSDRISRVEVPA